MLKLPEATNNQLTGAIESYSDNIILKPKLDSSTPHILSLKNICFHKIITKTYSVLNAYLGNDEYDMFIEEIYLIKSALDIEYHTDAHPVLLGGEVY